MVVYHSFNLGVWTAITISEMSIVAYELKNMAYGHIYDDGLGNRYCLASLAS